MKQIILIAVCMLMTLAGYGQQVLAVKKNDAQSLLAIIQQANEINAAADAKRLYVIIPDGFYDLGKTVPRASARRRCCRIVARATTSRT